MDNTWDSWDKRHREAHTKYHTLQDQIYLCQASHPEPQMFGRSPAAACSSRVERFLSSRSLGSAATSADQPFEKGPLVKYTLFLGCLFPFKSSGGPFFSTCTSLLHLELLLLYSMKSLIDSGNYSMQAERPSRQDVITWIVVSMEMWWS